LGGHRGKCEDACDAEQFCFFDEASTERRAFDRRVLSILVPATTLGVGLGWLTASVIPEPVVEGLVGLIGAVFAANLLLRRGEDPPARPANRLAGTVWGAVSGFTSFVSHAGGPPYQIFVLPLRLEKTVFAGTTTILFAYVNAIKLLPYWALGQLSPASLKVAAVLTVPAVVSVFLGVGLLVVSPSFVDGIEATLVGIEVRNDGLSDKAGVARWTHVLADCIATVRRGL
jgi:uncharacterized membrane protein YfcA